VATTDSSNRYTFDLRGATPVSGVEARFAEERVPITAAAYRERLSVDRYNRVERLAAGTSAWSVGFVGVPGEERVSDASREEVFADAQQPTIAALLSALREKYGEPTDVRPDGRGVHVRWIHDLRGRPVSEASPLSQGCFVFAAREGTIRYSPDCGLTIAARIIPLGTNELLAESFTVTIVDQAAGYSRMQDMQQRLAQRDEERKAREAKDASRNARKPVL
jgi:hypothetical protein